MKRSKFAEELSSVMIAAGWARNPYDVEGAVADWTQRFPDVPIVDDGKTDKGRGSTGFDKVRRVESNGIIRFDWLSEKTAAQEKGGKIPTKFSLCTGNQETIDGIQQGVEAGASYPTIFVVKGKDRALPAGAQQADIDRLVDWARQYEGLDLDTFHARKPVKAWEALERIVVEVGLDVRQGGPAFKYSPVNDEPGSKYWHLNTLATFARQVSQGNGGAYWIAADLAPVIREYGISPIEDYPEGGYAKGKAPPVYVKWSSIRRSGGARLKKMRELGLPVDETVRIIGGVQCGPGWFKYPELTISLSSLGVRRSSWSYVPDIAHIPALLDGPDGFGDDWEDMA